MSILDLFKRNNNVPLEERRDIISRVLLKKREREEKEAAERGEIVPVAAGEQKRAASTTASKEDPSFGVLNQYTKNLTTLARNGQLDPVIGREKELENIFSILERRTKNNVMLVGDSGVGKSAIVNALAHRIVEGNVPNSLKGMHILRLDHSLVVSGAKLRSEIEIRVKTILKQAAAFSEQVILFVDDLHVLVNEKSEESMNMLIKSQLSRSISATSIDDFRSCIEKDTAFTRAFQPMLIDPPTVNETIQILSGLRPRYETHYGILISDKAITAAAKLSERYIPERKLPDKAIDLIDEAGACLKMAIESEASTDPEMAEVHIRKMISKKTGIPVEKMGKDDAAKLMSLEKNLNSKVIGQEYPVRVVSHAIRRSRSAIGDPNRPMGSFLFLGPTGVGKTEIARVVAEYLFDDQNAMIRLDMSEYQQKETVARLIGPPPGYVGHGEGGQLTEPVRRKPYSVVLFDEIEKAHPDVFTVLLQVLDDGRLSDSQGHVVNFKNTIIMLTSNIGAEYTLKEDMSKEEIDKAVMDEVKKKLRPELLNRFDEVAIFSRLNKEGIRKITDIQLKGLIARFKEREIELVVTDDARDWLTDNGYDPKFGARPLKRAIQRNLENPLSEGLMSGEYSSGFIHVDCQDGKLVIT